MEEEGVPSEAPASAWDSLVRCPLRLSRLHISFLGGIFTTMPDKSGWTGYMLAGWQKLEVGWTFEFDVGGQWPVLVED